VRLKAPVDAEVTAKRPPGPVVADKNLFGRFLSLRRLGAEDIKVRVAESEFLGAVLDFLLDDEMEVIAFARVSDLAPEVPMMARRKLSGMMHDGG
jgi:hypothetical protein